MEPVNPLPPATNPTSSPTVPTELDDTRSLGEKAKDKLGSILDAAEESVLVDQATNAAAVVVRERGERNKKALAKKIDAWINSVADDIGGFGGRILKMLPLKTLLGKGIDKLIDVIADWLEDFSDAMEDEDEAK